MTLFRSVQTILETRPPLILHVTEALGGGVEAAILDYARSAPQYRHALLFTRRGSFATDDALNDVFEVIQDAGTGFSALAAAYRGTVRTLAPSVIHLHSAWAGLIGRFPGLAVGRVPVVYSPHSFYFERRDRSRATRRAARWLERQLSRRVDVVAALSPHERAESQRLGANAVFVPNVVRVPRELRWSGGAGADEIVVVGRVAAQKDPAFFLAVVAEVGNRLPDARWTWVGGGEEQSVAALRERGVAVTGWVPRAQVLARLARSAVYLHTASWEGSPIVLLEAATIGVPIVARSIDSLVSLGYDADLRTPREVADRLVATVLEQRRASARRPAVDPAAAQVAALRVMYGDVLAAADRSPALVPAAASRAVLR